MSVTIKVLPKKEMSAAAATLIRCACDRADPDVYAFLAVVTLGGDRITCCDEAVVAFGADGVTPTGIATIAPRGECGDGGPEIVGLFVAKKYRTQGLGESLFAAAVARCRERGFTAVGVTTITLAASRLVARHCAKNMADVAYLRVRDMSASLLFLG
jgi:GNAT superfamily N-acetyltransferase